MSLRPMAGAGCLVLALLVVLTGLIMEDGWRQAIGWILLILTVAMLVATDPKRRTSE